MFLNNEDLRSIKTERALYDAMFSLLKNQNFKKITVKEICEKALISRAAFYAHFIDKYDLLKQWMNSWIKKFHGKTTYEQIEQTANSNIDEKRRILKNLIYDADNETYEIVFDFILSIKNMTLNKNDNKNVYQRNVVLSNFYVGGIISYILWQIKNDFPTNVPLMNSDFYKIINDFHDYYKLKKL